MNDGTVELQRIGRDVIFFRNGQLEAKYAFSSESDCREAELLAEQIVLAYQRDISWKFSTP